MPKGIQKSIQVYFSKLRKPTSQDPLHHGATTTTSTTSTTNVGGGRVPDHHDPHGGPAGWLLSACKHPRTPSFAADDRDDDRRNEEEQQDGAAAAAATLKDVDRFLFENFRSLYKDDHRRKDDDDDDDDDELAGKNINDAISCESPTFVKTPPSLRASHRFFVSTSADNSLFDVGPRPSSETPSDGRAADVPRSSSSSSSSSSSTPGGTSAAGLPVDSLAVLTYSRRPYDDFRRSMQEMVEARQGDLGAQKPIVDWDFMEELLFCYLRLNERRAHKYILGAFVDLIVSFRPVTKTAPAASRPRRKKAAPKERRRRRRNAESSDERY